MKLFTGTIAYLPRAEPRLLVVTRRSTQTTDQFRTLGRVMTYHAQTSACSTPELCAAVHASMLGDEIVEYHNGGLIHNWGCLLRRGFYEENAEWVMFVSNDVYWHDGAVHAIESLLRPENEMTYYLGWPTAVFLMSRNLWDLLQPNWFDDYPPAGLDDIELACQVLAAGGVMKDHGLDSLFDHPVLSNTGTMLQLDRRGERPSNAPGCAEIFRRRWVPPMRFEPNSESVVWPPTPEQIAEIRKNPKREP